MALGAGSRNILGLVLKKGMGLALTGVTVGLAVSFVLTRLMESLLFGISATDPWTIAGAMLLLTVIAAIAAAIPARQAAVVDPSVALRID